MTISFLNASRGHYRGFTLVEVLIIIAIIMTILSMTVLLLNPVEFLRRGRDAQRLRDYTLINQAVNLYSYGAAVGFSDPDYDGPNYGTSTPTDSCKGDNNQRIFVSVPSDNGETPPADPDGWSYQQVLTTPYRNINGNGWLPIDFMSVDESIRPLNTLPVDPTNTFDSGFYYSYTCGSYELNLRFESERYQTLAASDGGDDPNVYEIGIDLAATPYQDSYHPETAGGSSATGTLVLYPNGTGYYSEWSYTGAGSGWDAVNDPIASPNSSDYVNASSASRLVTFALEDPSQSGTITAVRVYLSAGNSNTLQSKTITPRVRACDGANTADCLSYDGTTSAAVGGVASYNVYSHSWAQNPHKSRAWSWDDITTLQAGAVSAGTYTGSELRVRQLYIEVDYQQ